jgi:hypothetical protein
MEPDKPALLSGKAKDIKQNLIIKAMMFKLKKSFEDELVQTIIKSVRPHLLPIFD